MLMVVQKNTLARLARHPVSQGTVVALAVCLAGTLLLSLIFYATSLSETYLQPSVSVLYLAGAFFGGFAGARKAGRKGIQFGVETGLCYYLVVTVIILILAPAAFTRLAFILKGLYSLIAAAAGGIFGIAFSE
jgi:putative membrane protein (TIGR04086 family)